MILEEFIKLVKEEAFSGSQDPADCQNIRMRYDHILKLMAALLNDEMLENMILAARAMAKQEVNFGEMWRGASGVDIKEMKLWQTKFDGALATYKRLCEELNGEETMGQIRCGSRKRRQRGQNSGKHSAKAHRR